MGKREVRELRPVKGWEGLYAVTDDGRVRSLARDVLTVDGRRWKTRARWLKTITGTGGYKVVTLYDKDRSERVMVHRLVAFAFLPPPTAGQTDVNHKDYCRANNGISNLEWCTRSENTLHGWLRREVTPRQRAAHVLARLATRNLSFDQAQEIRARAKGGEVQAHLAREFSVARSTVCQIVRNKTYLTPTGERNV
jgi:hypothetical protein